MRTGLEDATILVTGAAGGIGTATVLALAAAGARIVLHYRQSRDQALTLAETVADTSGEEPILVDGDLRDPAEVDQIFETALREVERIDAIVVNHGIWESRPTPLVDMDFDQWRTTLSTNLDASFLVCRAFLRHLRDQPRDDASIVLIGSTAGLFGEADHADYAASKSALTQGLLLSLKNEVVRLAPAGRINAVCPGWTLTPMAAAALQESDLGHQLATVPLHRVAQPDDVANAVVWLSSPLLSRHVTGVELPVAGGMEGRIVHPPS